MDKKTKLIVLVFCILKLVLHLIADSHSGFQGDELLHIETGKHLAFGYMEFPPFIGIVAYIQNLFHSNSIFVHHLFSHIASILIIIYVAKTTIELGGKNKAVFLVLLCIIIAPSFGRSQQLFQPVVFSQLFWVLGFYQLVKFNKYVDKKSLWNLAFFVVLGISTKYDSLFFIFGLSAMLFYRRTREALIAHQFWQIALLSFLCILPNIVWQFYNDFPIFQMFSRLYEKHLDGISRIENFLNLLLAANLLTLFLTIPAVIYLLAKNKNSNRTLITVITMSFLLLLLSNGKSYYFYPFILILLPFGGIFWEQIINKRRWIIYPISLILALGSVLIPFGMPVYSFNTYLKTIYKYEHKEINNGLQPVKYDEYYTKNKWENTLKELQSVYDSLPNKEKQNCLIWGKHYGQAGIVNLLRSDYNLPKAFSLHGSFYSWLPKGNMPETTIVLSYNVGDFFDSYFGEIKQVRSIYNPYAEAKEELYQKIYICKKPKQDFAKMKELFKNRIFE
jgi:hypothetical protein